MRYVVTGLVPARIEVRPSNGLGSSKRLNLEICDASPLSATGKQDATTMAQGGNNPLSN
jgi:hypothetical protein